MENKFSQVWIPTNYKNISNFNDKTPFVKFSRLLACSILSVIFSVLSLLNHRYMIHSIIPVGLVMCLIVVITLSVSIKYFASNIGVVVFIFSNILVQTILGYIYPNSVFIVYGHIEGGSIFSDMSSLIYLNGTTILSFVGFLVNPKK